MKPMETAMPRYFFNLRDGDDIIFDPEGRNWPDVETARRYAVKAAREMLAEKVIAGEIIDGQEIIICNAEGEELDVVVMQDEVRPYSKDQ